MKTKILEIIDKFIEIEKRYDAVYTVDTFKELRQEIEEMEDDYIPLQQALDFADYYHNGLLNRERGSVEEEWEKFISR